MSGTIFIGKGRAELEKLKMTKREHDVYSYILEYRKEKRFSPSMRDIAAGVGLHSVSTIHVHVHNLMDKGWLQPVERMNRTIIPIDDDGV